MVFTGVVIGAYLEATSLTFSLAICAGAILALSNSSSRITPKLLLAFSFGGLFLFMTGASILAAQSRTDTIAYLKTGLLHSGGFIVIGAGLLYISFVIRMCIIPLISESHGVEGWIVGMGPGWVSAWILSVRITESLPQRIIADLSSPIRITTIIALLCLGITVLRNRSETKWIHQIVSGLGIVILFITWSIPFQYRVVLELLIRTSIISLGIYLLAPFTDWLFSGGRLFLKLGLAGFPLFISYDLRKTLYLTVEGIGINIGFIILWLFPLIALYRGLEWHGKNIQNRLFRYIVGSLALVLGAIGLVVPYPDISSVWIHV